MKYYLRIEFRDRVLKLIMVIRVPTRCYFIPTSDFSILRVSHLAGNTIVQVGWLGSQIF